MSKSSSHNQWVILKHHHRLSTTTVTHKTEIKWAPSLSSCKGKHRWKEENSYKWQDLTKEYDLSILQPSGQYITQAYTCKLVNLVPTTAWRLHTIEVYMQKYRKVGREPHYKMSRLKSSYQCNLNTVAAKLLIFHHHLSAEYAVSWQPSSTKGASVTKWRIFQLYDWSK